MTEYSKDMFQFAEHNDYIHDKKFATKPVGYLKDAWRRFKKNKGSIAAGCIILFLFLFAIIVPFVTPYTVEFRDEGYKLTLPRNELFVKLGIPFWDGGQDKDVTQVAYDLYNGISVETGHTVIMNNKVETYGVDMQVDGKDKTITHYVFRLDSYQQIGNIFKYLSAEEYADIQKYQDETGIQVLYPITIKNQRPANFSTDANYWFKTNNKGAALYDENGEYQNIYMPYNPEMDVYTSKMRIEGEVPLYNYGRLTQTNTYEVRVNYYEYFKYYHSYVLKDGIGEPSFLLGTNALGQDILTCLASGARFSFMLAIAVAIVNLSIGSLYGAVEGYFGSTADIIMERVRDILSGVPFIIVITLMRLHYGKELGTLPVLFISFFLTGWVGMAGNVRMQFYRYKNQEYVLAARTLGASDGRIMFKHIFPNALGTLITSVALVIPSVIFSETSLSYLGIIDVSSGTRTSVGTLLAAGQPYLATYPHIILFPAIFISLLMLSFNLFGNGLRDAFNPSLRGVEE